MNIVLIGYRCTGKTSVGRILAAELGVSFYDADALIQEEDGRTILEIVQSEGWPVFRDMEKKIIAQLALQDRCVIALGGGAVLDPDNVAAMKVTGRIIWLLADLQTIMDRLAKDGATIDQRPPLLGRDYIQETAILLEERTPLYRAAADLAVDTQGRMVEDIVGEIIQSTRKIPG